MSDEKQASGQESYELDDILKEVASWSGGEAAATPDPTPEPAAPSSEVAVPVAPTAPVAPAESVGTEESKTDLPENITVLHPEPPEDTVALEAETEADEKGKEEREPPNNLIPFTSPATSNAPSNRPPDPENLLELASLVRGHVKEWMKERRKKSLPSSKRARANPKVEESPPPQAARVSKEPPPPDIPPKQLAQQYGEKLSSLRGQCVGSFICAFLLLVMAVLAMLPALPVVAPLQEPFLFTWVSCGLFVLTLLFSHRLLLSGFAHLCFAKPGMHTLATLGALLVLADALTLQLRALRAFSPPLFAPAALVLAFQLLGMYRKRRDLRILCRTAASAAAPDLMTAEPSQWNGKPVYRRRFGSLTGFGSQVQEQDGAEQCFRIAAPLLLLLALLLSVAGCLYSKNPQLILWTLSATITAAATFSGTLCFCLPYGSISRRLSGLGIALAGWTGITAARTGTGLLVEDTDLFPPGSVEVTSFRAFAPHTPSYVISVTASVLRAADSGLDPLFYTLMRTESGSLVNCTDLELHSEGISAQVAGEVVLVGNLTFLARRGVNIPPGVAVRTGVFCAIGDSFAGQFILEYKLHKSASAAMNTILSGRITPVLIGLDFNLVPAVLRKLFRFPWDKMAFPDISQRAKLRHSPIPKGSQLIAVLCLQGLTSVSTAAIGAQRLCLAVRVCTFFVCLGAAIGVLMTAFLGMSASFSSLNPIGLTLYLVSWLVPTLLVSGWVNQF